MSKIIKIPKFEGRPSIIEVTSKDYDIEKHGHLIAEKAAIKKGMNAQEISVLEETLGNQPEQGSNKNESNPRYELIKGRIFGCMGVILILAVIQNLFLALEPALEGQFWLCVALSTCAGVVIPVTVEVVLEYLSKELRPKYLTTVIVCIALSAAIAGIIASTKFADSRIKISEAYAVSSSEASMAEVARQDSKADVLAALKREITKSSIAALVLLNFCIELSAGLILFYGLNKIRRCSGQARALRQHRHINKAINKLRHENAFLTGLTPKVVIGELRRIQNRAKIIKGLFVLAATIAVILGTFACTLLFSGVAGAAERQTTSYVIALDCSGSGGEGEFEKNQKAILALIGKLQPGDSIIINAILENPAPQTILTSRLPEKQGYFSEHLISARQRLAKAFLRKTESINTNRPGTALLGSLFYLGKMCQEQNGKRILILYSDMRPHSEVKVLDVHRNGPKIIDRLNRDGLIPPLQGVSVYCMGVSPHSIDRRHYKSLESFWDGFFKTAGAELKRYSISRQPID